MAILIPTVPVSSTEITLRVSATDQTPYLGGPSQRIARMGDRWSYKVNVRPLRVMQAGPLVTALTQGLTGKVMIEVRQDGVDPSAYSNATVVGPATGRALTFNGGGPAKFVGQFFSVVKNGVRYLHQVTSVSGPLIQFFPMLRVPLTGGEILEFGSPKLEGFIEGTEQSWTVGMVANLGVTFTVTEAQ